MMHSKLLIVLIFSISTLMVSGQGRNCASVEYNRQLEIDDPGVAVARQEIEAFTSAYMNRPETERRGSRDIVTIPVVVHVLYHPNVTFQNIPYSRVQEQIDVLNEDFRALNADTAGIPGLFKGDLADTEIQFCLATRDPQGNWTDGVTRTATTYGSFAISDNAIIKSTAQGGHDPWDRNKYLNIWVCNLSGNILGYSQLPGGPSSTDGTVISYQYFGVTQTSYPYNQGRTTTHEIGHYFNLLHIWGDDNGACWGSDYCDDTPNQAWDNYGCPSFPHPSCSNTSDMFMNYMDYVDDACMFMFTNDQSDRMWATLDGFRAPLKSSDGCSPHVGLPEVISPSELDVFPVPSVTSLNVSFKLPLPVDAVVSLYNELGELVMTRHLSDASAIHVEFPMEQLPAGLYVVKVDTPGNSISRKVIHNGI